jgi:hypothetical protein
MKPKKLNKKLPFNKNTISNLSSSSQQEVQGGGTTIISRVNTFCPANCQSAEPTWPDLCVSCTCRPPCYLP